MAIITNKKNIDISSGFIYPINSEEQGKTFEKIKPFMSCMRYSQLIKKVTYKIEIEYYNNELDISNKKLKGEK